MMMNSAYFQPLKLGSLNLRHRIVMAPLTRLRASDELVPAPQSVDYYAQRATPGGLIITEATPISPETPYDWAPGIFTDEQERAWKKIVDAVHAKGGLICMQLWHIGRVAHPSWAELPVIKALGGKPGVSASDVPIPKGTCTEYPSLKPVAPAVPRPLETWEIPRLIEDYRRAAVRAQRAGFDAVELHAAHGYLLNQFLCDGTNKRTDRYGGSIENRSRLIHEVLETLTQVFGASRVGVRISPTYKDHGHTYNGTDDSNPEALYKEVVRSLNRHGLAYLLLSEPRWTGGPKNWDPRNDSGFAQPLRNAWARQVYDHPIIEAGGFTPRSGLAALNDKVCDAVAFGRWFISNPDLVERLRRGAPLNIYDRTTFYIRDPVRGYIDYPALDKAQTPLARSDIETMEQNAVGVTLAKL